ncbi:MAG: DegT/DnrJ/EryC1/StrS family aminotransferase [Planctomycetes bacterium]|nr:DegT/DnrJ/EryC1/StrS family aminotransferase [Planctomycetota bacterium]
MITSMTPQSTDKPSDHVPVAKPYLWGREKEYLCAALDEGWISSHGRFLDEFEKRFSEIVGVRYALSASSGTAALHLALDALQVREGDEVIVPDFTMMAPVFAVIYCGAKPVPVDVDATWTLDPERIEEAITPRTRGIIAVHTYGHPARMDVISEIARRRGLFVLEDAAESHGAEVFGRQVGTFGDAAVYSFYANKIVTTGEGGILVTNRQDIHNRAAAKKNMCFGPSAEARFDHTDVGFNYRMTNLQAAVGVAQLEYFDAAVKQKIEIADCYRRELADIGGLQMPPSAPWARNVYWVFGILIDKAFGCDRDTLERELASAAIETRRFFVPVHQQRWMSMEHRAIPIASDLSRRGLYLPSFIGMGEGTIRRIADAIRRIGAR